MNETVTESTALISLDLNLPAPSVVAEQARDAFSTIYSKIEEEIASFTPDVSTPKGRQEIASLAYKIARTKTGLDEAAKNVTADQKAIIDAVNKERAKMREDLDTLKATVRAPLDAWETDQKAKADRADRELHQLSCIRVDVAGWNSDGLRTVLAELKAMDTPNETMFGEQAAEVLDARQGAAEFLERRIEEEAKREAEQAELEQLRREKAEREERDRQEREAREAEEAAAKAEEERKAREAEEEARRQEERERIAKEAAERAEREAAEKIEAERREREAAEQRAKEAEERALQAERDAEARRVFEAEQERKREIEAEERRHREAEEAERRAKERELAAAEAERQRIEKERLAQEEADRQRAADLAHRKKINSEAVAALIKACGLDEKQAQTIVVAIYKEQIPHVAISY